jgi:type II secretory pathway pseudopilin PulG
MSRFSTTVSTIAALGTIAATSITAYKVFDNQQENTQRQQVIIEALKQQLEAKKEQPITPPVQVVQQAVTPPPPVLPASPTQEFCQSMTFHPDCKK